MCALPGFSLRLWDVVVPQSKMSCLAAVIDAWSSVCSASAKPPRLAVTCPNTGIQLSQYRDILPTWSTLVDRTFNSFKGLGLGIRIAPASVKPSNPEQGKNVIELEAVSKVFFAEEMEIRALNEIHLEIASGEYVAITGPSGCGKSTLLSLMGLLDSSTGGSYRLAGKDVSALGSNARAEIRNRDIGFVFQAFNLISEMTVKENVELPLTYRRDLSQAERRERVDETLGWVDMSHRADHYPAQLSGGQQQRVAIARALAGRPKILLADEPTGNLDSSNASMVMDLLDELHLAGTTLCMVTHDMGRAARAGRRITLHDGKVVDDQSSIAAAQQDRVGQIA